MAEVTQASSVASMEPEYAGFWIRFFAACIDLLLFAPIFILVKVLEQHFLHGAGGVDDGVDYASSQIFPGTPYQWTFEIFFDVLSLLVYAWFLSCKWQGSPGMRLLKFYISDKAGSRISFLRAFMWCASAVIGWLICGAGILYMRKDITIVTDMLFSCLDQKVNMLDCIPEIEQAIGIPYDSYEQLMYAAAGMFFSSILSGRFPSRCPRTRRDFTISSAAHGL